MALRRQKIQLARRNRSQRALWFRLSNNESNDGPEVHREEILLEQKDPSDNKNTQETETITS